MKKNIVRIPNSFIEMFRLRPAELKLACVFYSLIHRNTARNMLGFNIVVRQDTLARLCGFSVSTVQRTVSKLIACGFITSQRRTVTSSGIQGTYSYTVKAISVDSNYFVMDKNLLSGVNGQAFIMYATFCKLAERRFRRFYQSLNDLSRLTGMSKKDVIKAVKKLISARLVRKYMKKTKAGDFTDNTYEVCVYIPTKKAAKKEPLIFRQIRGLHLVRTSCTCTWTMCIKKHFTVSIADFLQFVKGKTQDLLNSSKFSKKGKSYFWLYSSG